MRIAIVTNWLSCEKTPLEGTFVTDLSDALAEDHDVHVFHEPWLKGMPNWVARTWYRAGVSDSLNNAGEFDIVHAHGTLGAGEVARAYHRRTGTPYVLTEHACPFSMMTDGYGRRNAARQVLLEAAMITGPSAQQAKQLEEFSGCRTMVIPNLVPYSFAGLRRPDGRRLPAFESDKRSRILFLGPLTERKGADILLEAVDLAGAPEWSLTVVGDGPWRQNWEAMAHRKNELVTYCRRGVTIPAKNHFEARECARGWIEWSDVVVCPSRQESFGMVAAEAITAGRRAIVFHQHPLAGRPGITTVAPDPHLLLAAMTFACEPRPISISTGEFLPNVILPRWEMVYEQAIAKRQTPDHRKLSSQGGV